MKTNRKQKQPVRPPLTPEDVQAVIRLRCSGASGPHDSRPKSQRTRGRRNRAAIADSY